LPYNSTARYFSYFRKGVLHNTNVAMEAKA